MKKTIALAGCCFAVLILFSQDINVYPTHWWVGMKNSKLQLIIHEKDPGIILAVDKLVVRSSSPVLKITKVNRVENRRYLFLDCEVSPKAKPQTITISFGGVVAGEWRKFSYELKARSKEDGKTRIQGVTAKDFIYLLMPDRFANGDPSNDYFVDMLDTAHSRNNPFDRHGGDLQGVVSHLDYLKDLGVTTIWMTPVVENNMSRTLEGGTSRSTYHGYAFTDQYTIDRRLGGNDGYRNMVDASHTRGLKVIQDAVYNHIGNDHWSIKDPPMKDWLNQWPTYTNTAYKDQPLIDPYASDIDKKITTDGWFTAFLPDLNQRNPYVANFLIQYAIWATEEFGIDGWRVDTYFYNDPVFLNKINDALIKEFPALTVFGETSVNTVVSGAFFSQNNMNIPFKHNAQGITDFPLFYAMVDALKKPGSEGVDRLYSALAQDILYKDPFRNCIFLDNHDQDRIFSVMGEDFDKFKMGINWLLTLRGIPQLYYGTEILMKNIRVPTDAEVRKDFPGGWAGDPANKFTREGRSDSEQVAWDYVSKLANYRKNASAITNGKLMQYVPQNGVYIYFRYNNKQTVMVISNMGDKPNKPDWKHLEQRINGFTKLRNVITGKEIPFDDFEIQPKESFVFELLK
jgi:neopullulanase